MPGLIDIAPLLRGLAVTLELTAAAAVLALPIALAAGLARCSSRRWLRWPAAAYVETFRGTSALVQLFWFYFVLPFFGPIVTASRLPRRFAADLNEFRGVPLHVSRGVGMERGFSPPVRFLCPPEVCVLDVRLRHMGARIAAAGR